MVAFTRNLAVEVAGAGINVNCVAPGGIHTPGFDKFMELAGPDVKADFPCKRIRSQYLISGPDP